MPTQAQQNRVNRWIEKWRKKLLLLSAWTVHVKFSDRPSLDDPLNMAEMSVNENYLEIHIWIYPIFWEQPTSEQERTVAHELFHWYTRKLKDLALAKKRPKGSVVMDEVEQLTQSITNMLWRKSGK